MQNSKITVGTIARTICLILALVNQILAICGKDILPITNEAVYQCCTLIFTLVTAGVAWWKNNSFTQAAIEADKVLKELKDNDEGC